jgi:signal transduction histidine kinase
MGALRLDPRPQFLFLIVEEAMESLENGFRRKRIQVGIPDEMPAVEADRNTLLVMVRNLLSNALKFTPDGGRVTLSTRVDRLEVEMAFTDTGVGIPPDQLAALFLIDSKFSTPGTNQEPGTGLGLILCAEFAARNRGSLRVESTLGLGSTFFLRLPIARI